MQDDNVIVDEVLITLRRIIRSIDLHSKNLALFYGLTVPQFIVMREIESRDKVSIGEIARAVNLSHATVTDILGRLEKRKIIERSRSGVDKRCVNVNLTQAGYDLLKNAPSLLHEKFIIGFNKLKDYEKTLILSSLQRIADLMDLEKLKVAPILSGDLLTTANGEIVDNGEGINTKKVAGKNRPKLREKMK
jgi:DNA-binding MarR family transcriptional regulator